MATKYALIPPTGGNVIADESELAGYLADGYVQIGPPWVELPDDFGLFDQGPQFIIEHEDGRKVATTLAGWHHHHRPLGATVVQAEREDLLDVLTDGAGVPLLGHDGVPLRGGRDTGGGQMSIASKPVESSPDGSDLIAATRISDGATVNIPVDSLAAALGGAVTDVPLISAPANLTVGATVFTFDDPVSTVTVENNCAADITVDHGDYTGEAVLIGEIREFESDTPSATLTIHSTVAAPVNDDGTNDVRVSGRA